MDVEDRTNALLAADFADRVAEFDLRAVAIGGDGVATGFDLADDLRRENGAHGAVLVENAQRTAIEFGDDTDGRLAGKS